MSTQELDGQVAIVTGGGLGIGKAVTRALVRRGAKVVIAARRIDILRQAAEEFDGSVVPVAADTTDTESVQALAEAAAQVGQVSILVNGAAAPAGLVRDDVENADPEALLADLNT